MPRCGRRMNPFHNIRGHFEALASVEAPSLGRAKTDEARSESCRGFERVGESKALLARQIMTPWESEEAWFEDHDCRSGRSLFDFENR